MGGLGVNVNAVKAVLPERVAVIEDAAHGIGASFADGRAVGSSGNLTCFSFYANKNLATGEGGAIALADESIASRLRSLRQHGLNADAWKRFTDPVAALTPTFEELGYKMNYTDLQASIGRVQLRRQGEFQARRLSLAHEYADRLGSGELGLGFQAGVLEHGHARHLIMVLLPIERMRRSRNEVVLGLRQRNIGASIHYRPLHTIPLYSSGREALLPNTDWIAERVFTLPVSASMSVADAAYVSDQLLQLLHH
jgi:dTDP-4-amino-4,6-dideoxygalactose transaminase